MALPGATAEPSPEKQRADAQLREVNQQILQVVGELSSCDEKDIPKVTRRAQRLRVMSLMLREISTDLADPTTYRELSLLNKLVAGGEVSEEETNVLEEEAQRARLSDAGLDPDSASDMVRALRALETVLSHDTRRAAVPDPVPEP